MTDLRKAAQMAVVMLRTGLPEYDAMDVLCVLEDAIAQPERKPLTAEEAVRLWGECVVKSRIDTDSSPEVVEFARAIEKAHRIGGEE